MAGMNETTPAEAAALDVAEALTARPSRDVALAQLQDAIVELELAIDELNPDPLMRLELETVVGSRFHGERVGSTVGSVEYRIGYYIANRKGRWKRMSEFETSG